MCYNRVLVHIDKDVSEERASQFRFVWKWFLVEGEGSSYFSSTLDQFLQLLTWWHIVDNLIDIRVTKNIVKWRQHISTRYPKRPLPGERKLLLGNRDLKVDNIKYRVDVLCTCNKRYLTVRGQKGLPNVVTGN
jgi:hypothetical protein